MAQEKAGAGPFDFERFVAAQERSYAEALSELKRGRKQSHWMWYIFPQIEGLGFSPASRKYSIKSIDEARSYLTHPLLGPRLLKCCEAVLALKDRTAAEIFGFPDDVKLKSSMTLFASAAGPGSIFQRVLEKYFGGESDGKTLEILENLGRLGTERHL